MRSDAIEEEDEEDFENQDLDDNPGRYIYICVYVCVMG